MAENTHPLPRLRAIQRAEYLKKLRRRAIQRAEYLKKLRRKERIWQACITFCSRNPDISAEKALAYTTALHIQIFGE